MLVEVVAVPPRERLSILAEKFVVYVNEFIYII
jgi:hypothetical protein